MVGDEREPVLPEEPAVQPILRRSTPILAASCLAGLLAVTSPAVGQGLTPTTRAPLGRLVSRAAPRPDPLQTVDAELGLSVAVDVDVALLDALSPAGGDVLLAELLPGQDHRMVFDRCETVATGVNWIGHFADLPASDFVLSRHRDQVAANLRPADGTPWVLVLQPDAGGHFVRGFTPDTKRCGVSDTDPAPVLHHRANRATARPGGPGAAASTGSCCDQDPAEIRVLFVYTALAAAQASGQPLGPITYAQLAVAQTSRDLESTAPSGFAQRIVQVGLPIQWLHSESCDTLGPDLSALRSDPNVANLRDAAQADLVCGLIADRGSNCRGTVVGKGYVGNGTDDSLGFTVCHVTLAQLVTSHELGHNFGCRHEDCSGGGANHASSYQPIPLSTLRFQTRMWATVGSSNNWFSNPDHRPYGSLPTGQAGCTDNVGQIATTRQGIANFRGVEWASHSSYGTGWPGLIQSELRPARVPEVGARLDLGVVSSNPWTTLPGAVLLGFQRANLATPFGGTLLLEPLIDLGFVVGTSTVLPIDIPADPQLCGARIYAQSLQADPAASRGVAFSRGLELHLGKR